MQTEERYDDLSALFEREDDAIGDDAFVERVMQPIRKRKRWRTPLLFGAGGLGLGAALSQAGDLLSQLSVDMTNFNVRVDQVHSVRLELGATEPIWFAAVAVMLISCVAIFAMERA